MSPVYSGEVGEARAGTRKVDWWVTSDGGDKGRENTKCWDVMDGGNLELQMM